MSAKPMLAGLLAGMISMNALAAESQGYTADEIVARNVAARGGLEAWRRVNTLVWLGHIESATAGTALPFKLEMARPNKTRFEIRGPFQSSVRAYDGNAGWTLLATRSGGPVVKPFTSEELAYARDGEGIDGSLVDYRQKGISISVEGTDEVEGHKPFRLNVKLPSGVSHHEWIDAQNFLTLKYDRESRDSQGRSGVVGVWLRDYRAVSGVQIPFVIESGVGSGKPTDKLVLDRVVVNAPLPARTFAKPGPPQRSHMISIDTTMPESGGGPAASGSPAAAPAAGK